MIYFLIFFILFFGYLLAKSKFLTVSIYLLLLIISVFVQVGYDISNYMEVYSVAYIDDFSEGGKSPLFTGLMMISNGVGMSFTFFRFLCFLIWSLAIFSIIWKYSELPNYTIVCCFLFPLLSFSSQMRNGLAVGFIYIALAFLFKKKNFWNIFFFVLFMLIAVEFHKLSYFYFLSIIAILPISTKKLLKWSVFSLLFILLALLSGTLQSFLVSNSLNDYYMTNYIGALQYSLPLIMGLFFIVFFYTYLSYRSRRICCLSNNLTQAQKDFATVVCRINLVLLPFLPFLLMSGSFFRIFQNMVILSIISITNASVTEFIPHRGVYDRIFYFLFFFMSSIFYIYWQGGFFDALNSISLF